MPTPINIGTRDIPLVFAKVLSEKVKSEFESGSFQDKLTPITRDLLRFWFEDIFCENRNFNFHLGQKQAILNAIYVHEILKTSTVFDTYMAVKEELLAQMDLLDLKKSKYQHPKYAIKMATGTGKTWVIEALLIWQYLNAKHEQSDSGRFSKNFLLVAPGLIIYERLLNAFLGKEDKEGKRDFGRSDFKEYESLFIPPIYQDEVFGFIQGNVCNKEEIGRKVTGDGFIAITNWHLLSGVEEVDEKQYSALENPTQAVAEILPITPGTTAGHSLNTLDNQYFRGNEIEFLRKQKNLVVINDEAHHIHENKTYGEIKEVEWQKSLKYIAETKGSSFIQIDFSATPYDVTGSGQKRTKHYFPHIIVDFDLRTAIHQGLVKAIALDRRKEIATLPLDFKAERNGREVVGLSAGQKVMLRAGLAKLRKLEEHFVALTKDKEGISNKYPKMFVICEDTKVSPKVIEYLVQNEGLNADDVVQIDSDKKGSIPPDEWQVLKQKLFDMDKHSTPKVIVSVLMLREGFDVNNICVIVPLRSSQAPILLEQTVGRGLRLMWREPEYKEIKDENRELLLKKKKEPKTYMDILSIIEHPAFLEFYDDLIKDVIIEEEGPESKVDVLGDIINVGLKSNYQEYDLFFPVILMDREETLVPVAISIDKMKAFDFSLEQLKKMTPSGGDKFYSEEITVKTRFGDYEVRSDVFNSKSYNEFLGKLVESASSVIAKVSARKQKEFPVMQINQVEIARALDNFIRTKLFNQEFNPFADNNWRILLLTQSGIVDHIIKEISKAIYELQNNIDISEAVVVKNYFSRVSVLKMRENYCLNITKTIYEKQAYPSNKGLLEKSFMEFCDSDSLVEAFVKVNENYHDFARISYVRTDSMLGSYSPDFVVKTKDKLFIVETKAETNMSQQNVKLKQIATLDWVNRINQLKPEDRMGRAWEYVLLGENTFYELRDKGASIIEIFNYVRLTKDRVEGTLF
ncbi:MAG: restriction endonuclease subunit R [Candidatus Firestonebacteria bacterium RIFOXYA2_FULL_40_8]|nr:MAG: restriction endonuclease subunit R [Candidatus Firestonebacteria bacterium RIFOXYA2_FULL_40_8]